MSFRVNCVERSQRLWDQREAFGGHKLCGALTLCREESGHRLAVVITGDLAGRHRDRNPGVLGGRCPASGVERSRAVSTADQREPCGRALDASRVCGGEDDTSGADSVHVGRDATGVVRRSGGFRPEEAHVIRLCGWQGSRGYRQHVVRSPHFHLQRRSKSRASGWDAKVTLTMKRRMLGRACAASVIATRTVTRRIVDMVIVLDAKEWWSSELSCRSTLGCWCQCES